MGAVTTLNTTGIRCSIYRQHSTGCGEMGRVLSFLQGIALSIISTGNVLTTLQSSS